MVTRFHIQLCYKDEHAWKFYFTSFSTSASFINE